MGRSLFHLRRRGLPRLIRSPSEVAIAIATPRSIPPVVFSGARGMVGRHFCRSHSIEMNIFPSGSTETVAEGSVANHVQISGVTGLAHGKMSCAC